MQVFLNADPSDPLLPFAFASVLLATATVDVYGESYMLYTVQYAATDSDQIFVLFPFGFSCSADECGNVSQCAYLADDQLTCIRNLADLKTWNIRPQGGLIEHSINSCVAQAVPYTGRLPYQAIRSNTLLTGSSGLPQDIRFRGAYQSLSPTLYPEPNRCEASDPGIGPVSTNNLVTQALEHTCPLPNIKQGPTDPTPPLGVTGAIGMPRPPESIPFWRWSLTKVDSDMANYTAIYAGITSTKTAYDLARAVPLTGTLLPDCAPTRTFHGVTSDIGHSFWAYHGVENADPDSSGEMSTSAGAAAALMFRRLANPADPPAFARYLGYVGTATAVADQFNENQSYDCDDYPISTSVLCAGGGEGVAITASRTMHPMPEVNIILADTLDHPVIGCYADYAPYPARLYVFGTREVEGNVGANNLLPFIVERTGDVSQTATFNYATEAGPADSLHATPGSDYQPVSGSLSFVPGEQRKTINVPIIGDSVGELAERVLLTISNVSGAAAPNDPTAFAVIDNDD